MKAVIDWLIESGWQSAVMAVIVSILLLVGRKQLSPAWKYALLLLIVARLLLPVLPASPISAYRVVPATPAQAWQQAWSGRSLPSMLERSGANFSRSEEAGGEVARPGWDWRGIFFSIWVIGAAGAASWLVGRQIFFTRRFYRARRSPSDEVLKLAATAARAAGLRHRPRMWCVEEMSGPVLVGLWRPVLLLPQGIESRLTREQLHLILLHECLHLRRIDPWTHAASLLAWTLHWWNPVAWWLLGRLRVERELATDAGVLARVDRESRRTYGETLLGLAQGGGMPGGMMSPALGILDRHGDLKRRILQISAFARTRAVWTMAGAALLVITAGLLLAKQIPPVLEPIPKDTEQRENLIRDFMDAAGKSDFKKVAEYLDRGLDVNSSDGYETALYEAINSKDLKMVRYLLGRGASVAIKNDWGDYPATRASFLGEKEVADVLIAAGSTIEPNLYDAGTGDLPALKKLNEQKTLTKAEVTRSLWFAVATDHTEVFDWLWAELKDSGAKEAQGMSLLEDFYKGAAKWGAFASMAHLEKMGVGVKKVGPEALENAVGYNNLPEAKYLLEQGVSPQKQPGDFRDMLGDAAGEGRLEMVKLLVEHGASLNNQDGQGLTALSWAAYSGHQDVCEYLIDQGARIDLKDKEGLTALSRAAFGGASPEVVEKLIKKGADVHEKSASGEPILCGMQRFVPPRKGKKGYPGEIYDDKKVAEFRARMQKVTRLLVDAGADMKATGFDGTPLMTALSGGHPEIAEVLIEKGADINQTDQLGNTAISMAFSNGWDRGVDYQMVKLLLDKGANPNASLSPRNTRPPQPPVPILNSALIVASYNHDEPDVMREIHDVVGLLLERGAKFQVDDQKTEPWLAAAATGNLGDLKKMRAAGVDINAADRKGWTALTISQALGDREASDWLMQQGASLKAGASGYTPLYFAIKDQDVSLVRKVLAEGVKPDTSVLSAAVDKGNLEVVKMLLAAGGKASEVNVWPAIRSGSTEILGLLLENGAETDSSPIYENRNSAYWAVSYDHFDCLKLLLKYGADPNMKDDYGGTTLKYAQQFRKNMVPTLEAAIKDWNARHPESVPKTTTTPTKP